MKIQLFSCLQYKLNLQVSNECATQLAAHAVAMCRGGELQPCLGAVYIAHQLLAGGKVLDKGSSVSQSLCELEGLLSEAPSTDQKLVRLIRSHLPEAGALLSA